MNKEHRKSEEINHFNQKSGSGIYVLSLEKSQSMNVEGLSQTLYPKILLCNEKAYPSSKQKLFLKSKQVRQQEFYAGYETADET